MRRAANTSNLPVAQVEQMLNGTRKFEQIVSVSSISDHRVYPACAAHTGTKFAGLAIPERLGLENHDVYVMVISLRVVESGLAHTGARAAMQDFRNS
jgi:NADP-dependent 3-hydroxy acid dehydrogenase YdfG